MSQQFIHIPSLLRAAELSTIDNLISQAHFIDGKATASMAAKAVKNNWQIEAHEAALQEIQTIIGKALAESPLFQATAFPQQVYPIIISRYEPGQSYGWHVDSPMMGQPPMRTDLAMTIFLSDHTTYTGGELVLQTGAGVINLKPSKGDAIVYPCQYLHCVNEVTQGQRLAAVTWIQSTIRQPEQRQILFQLTQIHASLTQQSPLSPEANLLLQTHSNLFRMWAEM